MKQTKGFTLIELLVVIAIIGILATVIITVLGDARKKARDARRVQDIKQIQTALEVYYLENGRYPNAASWVNSSSEDWDTLIPGVSLPKDPINESGSATAYFKTYSYFSHPNSSYCANQAYLLVFNKESSNCLSDGVLLCGVSTYSYGDACVVGVSPMM